MKLTLPTKNDIWAYATGSYKIVDISKEYLKLISTSYINNSIYEEQNIFNHTIEYTYINMLCGARSAL